MKTSTRQTSSAAPHFYSSPHPNPLSFPHTHPNTHSSHGASPSTRTSRGAGPTTPLPSPKLPYSTGQPLPPTLSPPRTRGSEKRSSSPSYFGLVVDDSADPRDSSLSPRHNWCPPSGNSVKSFAAAVPKQQVSLEGNSEFEAFRKQVDAYRARGLSSSTTAYMPPGGTSLTTTIIRPRAPRSHTQASDSTTSPDAAPLSGPASTHTPGGPLEGTRMDIDQGSLHDSAYVSGDSKRNSEACVAPPQLPSLPGVDSPERSSPASDQKIVTPRPVLEEWDRRASAPSARLGQYKANPPSATRAQTAPPKPDANLGPSLIVPEQLRQVIEDPNTRLLLIDVRSAQSYAASRIRTALNLCIPTMLLKRPTFNLQKLQQTFQDPGDKDLFSKWKDTDCLVVYDACSSEKTEATTAMSMIKKFTNEGYTGGTFILRGGFRATAEDQPDLIYHRAADDSGSGIPVCGSAGLLAPVIGGVMLPTTNNKAIPFFSNIRQNMDLADGVGQMDIAKPKGLASSSLPRWLRLATEESNHGKDVSDKFLGIEKDEQARMRDAYSLLRSSSSPNKKKCVELCGIEQGARNRYKDILPFEHSRVKLPAGLNPSDYFNANHVKASRSNKRYLATQGPLPSTFDDFWSVIWDQDVRVIVMLTAESEGGQLKCHAYWNNRDYGSLRLRLLSERKISLDIDRRQSESPESGRRRANTTMSAEQAPPRQQGDTPHVIIRKFSLSHAAQPFAPIREITHLHYPSWPDFGVPARASHLLALVELANVMQRSSLPVDTAITSPKRMNTSLDSSPSSASPRPTTGGLPTQWVDEPEASAKSRPMMVHCSAGCGRTGTFCTVDSVIDMLKRQRMSRMNKFIRKEEEDVVMDDVPEGVEGIVATSLNKSQEPRSRVPSSESLPEVDGPWLDDDEVDLVQATVEEFRSQRLSMVQSLRQYVLCYETVMEWIWRVQERGPERGVDSRKRSGSVGLLQGAS
ncbi:related to protein-tyrosine-phosphatase [Cephalotrichum gorgonifer]|uniref:protein-tyrosine-phosphatase n=1 Tax=Cephalotrichum gorgonifer TaxID=2041049 RepID=A0AAE8N160_9PEZI|nr:related to protein-tyrosine-phosphatase [Cephalotrichum gorgonifer]